MPYRLARDDQEALAAAPAASNEARRDLADTIHRTAILLSDTGKKSEAEAEYRKAMALCAEAGRRLPRRHRVPPRLAGSHNNLGVLLMETGKPSEAEAEFRKAMALMAEAGRRQPRRHRIPLRPGEQAATTSPCVADC